MAIVGILEEAMVSFRRSERICMALARDLVQLVDRATLAHEPNLANAGTSHLKCLDQRGIDSIALNGANILLRCPHVSVQALAAKLPFDRISRSIAWTIFAALFTGTSRKLRLTGPRSTKMERDKGQTDSASVSVAQMQGDGGDKSNHVYERIIEASVQSYDSWRNLCSVNAAVRIAFEDLVWGEVPRGKRSLTADKSLRHYCTKGDMLLTIFEEVFMAAFCQSGGYRADAATSSALQPFSSLPFAWAQ